MSNPRAAIKDLELSGSPNLSRALKREPVRPLAKRAEVEALLEEVKARRAEALADVRKNGMVLLQDKWGGKGGRELIRVRVKNPSLTIAETCERTVASLVRLLNSDRGDGRELEQSAEDIMEEMARFRRN